jgi:DNA-binding transcriptional regulator YdaS (Cro superfamily)
MTSPITIYRKDNGLTLKAFGDLFGADKSTVLRWEERGVPVERVNDIERVTGISRHLLRPDIFGEAA